MSDLFYFKIFICMSEEIITYPSEFMNNMNITVVFKENPMYGQLRPIFDEFGYGFVAPELKTIIIDGEVLLGDEFTMDDLKFIEAHEIAHLKLNHNGPRNPKDEMEADLGAYILLKNKGYENAIQTLIDEYEHRHGIEFNEDDIKLIQDRFRF